MTNHGEERSADQGDSREMTVSETAIAKYQMKKTLFDFASFSDSSSRSLSASSSSLALLLAIHPPPSLHLVLALHHLPALFLKARPPQDNKKRFDGWKAQTEYKDCAWLIYRASVTPDGSQYSWFVHLFALNLFCFFLTSICL